jgi:dihydrofolate synthase/folylpolyglutamate synthase
VLTRCDHPRALAPDALAAVARRLGTPPAETVADPREAVGRARALAGPAGAVLVTGSLHLIADLRRRASSARLSTM